MRAKTFRARLECRDGIEHKSESGTKRAGFKGLRLKQAYDFADFGDDQ
jgi:hypothetical protein